MKKRTVTKTTYTLVKDKRDGNVKKKDISANRYERMSERFTNRGGAKENWGDKTIVKNASNNKRVVATTVTKKEKPKGMR